MKALVTGAAAGLGHALVRQLSGRGCEIVALDRDRKNLANLAGETGIHRFPLDLGEIDALVSKLDELAALGPYDAVFLNAGISATGRFETIPVAIHEQVIAVNATAPMILASGLVNLGALANPASLTFVSSLSHYTGYPGAASYAASKDTIAIYARSIAKHYAGRGIQVMVVYPGPIRTEHAARHAPPGADAHRRIDPDELAKRMLHAMAGRKRNLFSGATARFAAIAGATAPGALTALMRRVIFEKLDKEVW